MDPKLIFSALASVIVVIAFYPYIRDIFKGKTKPHIYTWLIWGITTGTATAGLWRGGGGSSAISMTVILFLVLCIIILSIKYGTKNITKADTAVLILALSTVVIWWQLDNPVLAVFMAALIDGLGYIPTYRKSWKLPYEETLSFWMVMVVIYILVLASIDEYNLLTVPYVGVVMVANVVLVSLLFFRRRKLNKSKFNN